MDEERIIRIIYSEKHINLNKKSLKPNFFRFDFNDVNDRAEMSCMRFEFETLEFCKNFGLKTANPDYDRSYYGFACISVARIRSLRNFGIVFTPNVLSEPKNYFHCDIYDKSAHKTRVGIAIPAALRFQREELMKLWKVYEHTPSLSKDAVLAI